MKWEIYKQLKPIEREWWEKQIRYEDYKLSDIFNLWYVAVSIVGLTVITFVIALIALNPKLTDVALILLQKLHIFIEGVSIMWGIMFVLGMFAILYHHLREQAWIKELGYEIKRKAK